MPRLMQMLMLIILDCDFSCLEEESVMDHSILWLDLVPT